MATKSVPSPSLSPAAVTHPSLGPLRETFRSLGAIATLRRHALEAAGLVVLSTVLIGGGISRGAPAMWGAGVAALALGAALLALRARERLSVDLHEHGLRVTSRRGERFVAWRDVGDVRARLVDLKTRFGRRPTDRLELAVDGAAPLVLDHRVDGLRRLIAAVEQGTADAIGARAQAALDAGQVFSIGRLHLAAGGWVVHGQVVPWRDLERIEVEDGEVAVVLASAGHHEVGSYGELSAAHALFSLASHHARREGRAVEVPGSAHAVATVRAPR